MGADGGTIPRRIELVKEKKKPEKKDKVSELKHKWNDCSVSQLPLQKPILACENGNLYNKESVLELLLDKQKFEHTAKFAHIRSLKDVKELNLTDNPAFDRTDGIMDTSDSALYVCPVTGLEMNGKHRFNFIWTCGCVLSERALREVRSAVCHKCAKAFVADDLIVLNGDDNDFELMKARMEARRLAAKQLKKSKKRSRPDAAEEPAAKVGKTETTKSGANGITEKTKSGAHGTTPQLKGCKVGVKQTLSVQKDPTASETYKSLFTSSDDAKKQGAQHSGWVSFNPQYFR